MTGPAEMFRDTMRRTMKNLRIIQDRKRLPESNDDEVFEVTALVMSFQTAFNWPQERDLKTLLEPIPIECAQKNWAFPELIDHYPHRPLRHPPSWVHASFKPKNMADLSKLIRNGFAHGNIKYVSDGKDITKIRVVNKLTMRGYEGEVSWGTIQSVDVWTEVLECFVKLANDLYERPEYVKQICENDS